MSFSSGGSGNKPKFGTIKLGDLKVKPVGSGGFLKTNFQVNNNDKPKPQNDDGEFNGNFNGGFRKPSIQMEQKKQFSNFNVSSFLEKNKANENNTKERENNPSSRKNETFSNYTQKQENSFSATSKNSQQFRKINFDFANGNDNQKPQEGTSFEKRGNFKQSGNNFSGNNGTFRKKNDNFNDRKGDGFSNKGGQYNRFEKNKGGFNDYGKNRGNGFNKDGNKSFSNGQGFRFKSNQVNIKRNSDSKKDSNNFNSFKRKSHGSSGVDKYSINGMLKTMTNDIELDTEMDEVLGNVISVKLSGINTANALQKERKTRVASKEKRQPINFSVPIVREIVIYNDAIVIDELAKQMAISAKELVKLMRSEGVELEDWSGETEIDGDTAELIANSCGHKIKRCYDDENEKEFINNIKGNRTDLKQRNPIVAIMGHVDHGKTTLLDTIRKTSVAEGEAGGITQHIGAYIAKVGDRSITFLDTPGHAAFTKMRARGAQITDIVIIVVSADDGIMPQTIEAINHAKSAGVPIIVAINKIDKPEANIERTENMLLQYEVVPEKLGGDAIVVPISAKNNVNIDKLLNAILLQADVLDLKAHWQGNAEGTVVESKLDKKRGAFVTIIVENGTLEQGDFVVAGSNYGKIKSMFDENGNILKKAFPSMPVEILGLNSTPEAGEKIYAVKSEKEAKGIIEYRQEKEKERTTNATSKSSVSDVLSRIKSGGEVKNEDVSVIVKADTKGSLEAIVGSIGEMKHDNVAVKVIHSGVGFVVENDILLAQSCGAYILTFNVQKCDKKVLELAEKSGVEIRDYKIIYEMFDDIEKLISGKLEPVIKNIVNGLAEVKAIFEISKVGKIFGCAVRSGKINIGSKVGILRNGERIYDTNCTSLRCGKENVKEVQNGKECGIGLEDIKDVHVGDVLEFFTTKEEKR